MTEPQPGQASNRYVWFVGLLAVAIVVYITINTIATNGQGSRGLQPGDHLPPFAAPLATSNFPNNADADIARRPNQGRSKVPACRFTDPRALNVCAAARRPLVLAFTVVGAGKCQKQLDTIEQVSHSFPQVSFAAIAIRASRSKIAPLVRKHGWTFPVAYDHDGAVANLYDVAICPTVTFAYPGGRVMKTTLGDATSKPYVLATEIRTLLSTAPRPATG
jgi:hypothetical protein